MPVLCLLCLYYAYYACTMPTMPVLCLLCLYYAYYACTMPTMPVLSKPVLCLLCLFITTGQMQLTNQRKQHYLLQKCRRVFTAWPLGSTEPHSKTQVCFILRREKYSINVERHFQSNRLRCIIFCIV